MGNSSSDTGSNDLRLGTPLDITAELEELENKILEEESSNTNSAEFSNSDGSSNAATLVISAKKLNVFPTRVIQYDMITKLDISQNNIQKLPPNISNLSSLKILCFRSNNLKEIPRNIERLANLETIDFSSNSIVEAFPKYFLSIPNLRSLDFTRNKDINLAIPENIAPSTAPLLRTLIELDVSLSHPVFPVSIWKHFTSLELLRMNDCTFENTVDINNFSGSTSMNEIDLTSCGISKFPECLCTTPSLRIINLNFNAISTIPPTISKLANSLQDLQLSKQNPKITSLPSELCHLTRLQRLVLDQNGIKDLPDNFHELTGLVEVQLFANELEAIPQSLLRTANIQILVLSSNQITGRLPDEIGDLINLKRLNLGSNKITALPESINRLVELEDLNLCMNEIESLPSLDGLVKLHSLGVSDNRLGMGGLQALPPNLTSISLGRNNFYEIPEPVFSLTELHRLEITYNRISTVDSEKLKNLQKLVTLSMDGNDLTEVPQALDVLTDLRTFTAADNSIVNISQELKREYSLTISVDFPSQILPRLYLGSRRAVNRCILADRNITHILTVANKIPQRYPELYTIKIIDIEDEDSSNLSQYFAECIEFIDSAINDESTHNSVLIHCAAGISRSASVVIAYIMKKQKKSFSEVFDLVRNRRPQICPNSGFIKQLKDFDTSLISERSILDNIK